MSYKLAKYGRAEGEVSSVRTKTRVVTHPPTWRFLSEAICVPERVRDRKLCRARTGESRADRARPRLRRAMASSPVPAAPSSSPPSSPPARLSQATKDGDLVSASEELLKQTLERIHEWAAEAPDDEDARTHLCAIVRVIDDSRAQSSGAVREFLANNEDILNKARAQVVQMGDSIGVAVPENMSENVERLREVLLGDSEESAKRAERATHLLKEGQDYLSELLSSEEAKHLKTEGTSAIQHLQQMEEAQRLKSTVSEAIGNPSGQRLGRS